LRGVDTEKKVVSPFGLLALPSTLPQQKLCADIWTQDKYHEIPPPLKESGRYSHEKIRLGYFSADFYNHATAYLTAELFELHDRNKFEIFGFSFGVSPNDYMRQRLSSAFDHFIDVQNKSDLAIASLAQELQIDIAIDLKGFTQKSRAGIFSRRAAPIQVNYLGYPGTMCAPYMDYIVADPTLIPVDHQQHYGEKIIYLPDSYQVNDSKRIISEYQFTREEVGLPDTGFVFCCFNNTYKITPDIFDIWMELLGQVNRSVLWLLATNNIAQQNLRQEAVKRGIEPERLIFAPRMELSAHLSRLQLANLFLDTLPCNAHTTASDSLWAGVPILTCLGDTFAGRVAASLLKAVGLPELITSSFKEYKSFALALATHPEKLDAIRDNLSKNRKTHPLFNIELFTKHLEDAFFQIWQRHQEFLPPENVYVK
jgi:predicted O-linked N-acetylglucosamine transferase (SPINDLY family)